MRRLAVLLCLPLLALPSAAADKGFDQAVKKVTATFEPAEAKPGQTVTWKLTVDLNPGYYTYALVQSDPKAKYMVNKLAFPEPGAVVFVGDATDSPNAKEKAITEIGIRALKYHVGTVVYERKAVVSPAAKAGKVTVTVPKLVIHWCDERNCYDPKTVMPEATLTVLDRPAVAVDAKYADEVKAATEKK